MTLYQERGLRGMFRECMSTIQGKATCSWTCTERGGWEACSGESMSTICTRSISVTPWSFQNRIHTLLLPWLRFSCQVMMNDILGFFYRKLNFVFCSLFTVYSLFQVLHVVGHCERYLRTSVPAASQQMICKLKARERQGLWFELIAVALLLFSNRVIYQRASTIFILKKCASLLNLGGICVICCWFSPYLSPRNCSAVCEKFLWWKQLWIFSSSVRF